MASREVMILQVLLQRGFWNMMGRLLVKHSARKLLRDLPMREPLGTFGLPVQGHVKRQKPRRSMAPASTRRTLSTLSTPRPINPRRVDPLTE